ncbi:MAG: hypothetical protein QNJ51_17035 [Calothrix sp. MO_167.B12]|nr:hypothetical protein [Calothrix sp. MO_167.B12]
MHAVHDGYLTMAVPHQRTSIKWDSYSLIAIENIEIIQQFGEPD